MKRIRIEKPSQWVFETSVTVRIADLNYGNHVGNDRYLLYAQEARCRYLKSLGFESEISIAANIGLVVTEAAIQYKHEAFHGDILSIKLSNTEMSRFGFNQVYLLLRNNQEVALIKLGLAFFDFGKRKITSAPHEITDKFT